MKIINSALAGVCLLLGCSAQVWAEPDDYYLGIGFGQSFITPETNSVALTVSKDTDFAYKLHGGYQWDEHWATEVFYSALGEAEISATSGVIGSVDYDTYGAAAMYKLPLTQDISFNVSGGVGKLQNKSRGIAVERVEDIFLYGGLGLQWEMTRDWDLRIDADIYDSDAQLVAVNLVRRFGSIDKRIRRYNQQESTSVMAAVQTAVSTASATDKDADGVSDANDKCLQSKPGAWVSVDGCSRDDELLQTVLFGFNSVELSAQAKQQLDEVAKELYRMPVNYHIEINAYADTVGTSMYNYAISNSRAHNVRDYLNGKGVSLGKLKATGFGEWHPVLNADGKPDQQKNRRAELKIVRD